MKYSFFLIAILVIGIFLPHDVSAQKRPAVKSSSAKKNTNRRVVSSAKKGSKKVKKTSKVSRANTSPRIVGAPFSLPNLKEALVTPRCNVGNDHFTVQIYQYPVLVQGIVYRDSKLQALKADGTYSTDQSSFISPQDYVLATKLLSILQPIEMELYPSTRTRNSTYITNLVFIGDPSRKWGPQDAEKVYQLLKVLLEPLVKVVFIGGECMSNYTVEEMKQ